jgi:hypothetical protein
VGVQLPRSTDEVAASALGSCFCCSLPVFFAAFRNLLKRSLLWASSAQDEFVVDMWLKQSVHIVLEIV